VVDSESGDVYHQRKVASCHVLAPVGTFFAVADLSVRRVAPGVCSPLTARLGVCGADLAA